MQNVNINSTPVQEECLGHRALVTVAVTTCLATKKVPTAFVMMDTLAISATERYVPFCVVVCQFLIDV